MKDGLIATLFPLFYSTKIVIFIDIDHIEIFGTIRKLQPDKAAAFPTDCNTNELRMVHKVTPDMTSHSIYGPSANLTFTLEGPIP